MFSRKICISFLVAFILLPLSLQAQQEQQPVAIGHYENLYSEVIGEERQLMIYLPGDYDSTSKEYPVYYLLDSDTGFRFAKALSTITEFADVYSPEMILVGIVNTNRRRDMFPPEKGSEGTGADTFLKFLTTELIPYIDGKYRSNGFRILCGHSNSGLFTLYAMLKQPGMFNGYFASSPMIGYSEETLVTLLEQYSRQNLAAKQYLHILYGDQDYREVLDYVPAFTTLLEKNLPPNCRYNVVVIPGEGHVPFLCYAQALKDMFAGFQIPLEEAQKGMAHVLEHYKALSDAVGLAIAPPCGVLEDIGRFYYEMKDYGQAIEVLQYTATKYPSSVGAHLFLARSYESIDRLEQALVCYKMIQRLLPNNASVSKWVHDVQERIEAKSDKK